MASFEQIKERIEKDFEDWSGKTLYNAPGWKIMEYIDNCLYCGDIDNQELIDWLFSIAEKN